MNPWRTRISQALLILLTIPYTPTPLRDEPVAQGGAALLAPSPEQARSGPQFVPLSSTESLLPTTSISGEALVNHWIQVSVATPIWSSPQGDILEGRTLPAGSFAAILSRDEGWLEIIASPGELTAWVPSDRLSPLMALPGWVTAIREASLWSAADPSTATQLRVAASSRFELLGPPEGGLLLVRYPGDGRWNRPGRGWVALGDVMPTVTPRPEELPRGYPLSAELSLRLTVPYRSQLDGSPWARANCGPATLGMGLASLGIDVSSSQLRRETQDAQRLWGDSAGTFMEAMVEVADLHGAGVMGFRENGRLKRWTLDQVREQVQLGRPVIVQVHMRLLPGRSDWPTPTDHFLILTGLAGTDFLYNDSIDLDGVGFDRLISAADLDRAMNAGDRRYAYAGFALTPR